MAPSLLLLMNFHGGYDMPRGLLKMPKKKTDPLIGSIEYALNLGQFISYNHAWDFIRKLENVKEDIDALINEDPKRVVPLYEVFLYGCTEKIEEIDDSSGSLGMFFEDLLCSWVVARQKSNCSPEETLKIINKWKEKDDYGLYHDVEKSLIKVFNKKTLDFFKKITLLEIEKAFVSLNKVNKESSTYPYSIQYRIELIKLIYAEKGDVNSYIEFVQKMGVIPEDCEEIAKILKKKKKYTDALKWVEKGLKLSSKKENSSFSSYELMDLKKELLHKLGNNDEVLNMAWNDFKKRPSNFSYRDLIKYIPEKNKKDWHEKVMDFIKDGPIESVIEICVEAKEYEVLVDRILRCKHKALEDLSHFTTEKAAKVLTKKYPEAAVKIYRALGIRIVNSKKSKYYYVAWKHFEKTKELYHKTGQEKEWDKLVENILYEHSRKSSFIGGFRDIAAGTKKKKLSFVERASQW